MPSYKEVYREPSIIKKIDKFFIDFLKPYKTREDILRDFLLIDHMLLLTCMIIGLIFSLLFIVIQSVIILPAFIIGVSGSAIYSIFAKNVSFLDLFKYLLNNLLLNKEYLGIQSECIKGTAKISFMTVFAIITLPLHFAKIASRLMLLYKYGWPDIWENEGLQREVANYNFSIINENKQEASEIEKIITKKLIRSFEKNQCSSGRYIKYLGCSDANKQMVSQKSRLVLRKGNFDSTISDLESKISDIRKGYHPRP